MISGFSSTNRNEIRATNSNTGGGNLPIPFNIPNVLYNLLHEDIGLVFDAKQRDIIEALRFSYKALGKMQEKYTLKEQDIMAKMLAEPDNDELKEIHEEIQLDVLQAHSQFKDLVIVISDLLTREQYQKLLKFSNINV